MIFKNMIVACIIFIRLQKLIASAQITMVPVFPATVLCAILCNSVFWVNVKGNESEKTASFFVRMLLDCYVFYLLPVPKSQDAIRPCYPEQHSLRLLCFYWVPPICKNMTLWTIRITKSVTCFINYLIMTDTVQE
jgi:hypothetical protein